MELSVREFRAMNNSFRRFLQRRFEFPRFKGMGLTGKGKRILEIGCGSGYGALLLRELEPAWYAGIDIMPEQIDLAIRREVPGCSFMTMDAADLSYFADGSVDTVVVFGILHHIPEWRKVLKESWRVLDKGGSLFLEEPDGRLISVWDMVFKWGHPVRGFTLAELEKEIIRAGFVIKKKKRLLGFGTYAAVKE
ncbi:MAG TPA: class I SAM-dependent methyltransferase [Spirochaetota bacterium]|nr:class I SAM-dependent methyltransferase [Spirochaetota bacterium]